MILSNRVLLVKPIGFRYNEETADDNVFQHSDTTTFYIEEFENLKSSLIENKIEVEEYCPQDESTPDAVFPNNWFNTFPDKRMFLYPMYASNRRIERRADLIKDLSKRYKINNTLIELENEGETLEGTGSLIIDHEKKTAFASLSKRTTEKALKKWEKATGYKVLFFQTADKNGVPIYHTNVILTLGEGFAIVCSNAIANEKEEILRTIQNGRELVEIDFDQMNNFCGNCLQLKSNDDRNILFMSERAYNFFTPKQIETIQKYTAIKSVKIDAIENIGGGSIRCMMAELF